MGLRIIHKKHSPKRSLEQNAALQVEAKRCAERKVGDLALLSEDFLNKVDDIRKLDTLGGSITKKAKDLSNEIRLQSLLHVHDEKAFDLERILNLI